jgi:hypothetical protein
MNEGRKGFVVRDKVCDDVAKIFEEKEDSSKRGDIGLYDSAERGGCGWRCVYFL